MTDFLGVTPTDGLGYRQYYRITFEAKHSSAITHPLFWSAARSLHYMYDHIQDTGVLGPLSPNPTVEGDTVAVVDVWTIGDASAVSVGEAVRRLQQIGGNHVAVQSFKLLRSIYDVSGGAKERDFQTQTVTAAKAAASPLGILSNFASSVGDLFTLAVIGLVAVAAITLARR